MLGANATPPDARVRAVARRVVVEVCWEQWRALGFSAGDAPGPLALTLVDPEALLVLTFEAVRAEPRLGDALDWWAAVGSSLLSLPRLDAALADAPDGLAPAAADFAARVEAAGSASASWKKRAAGTHAQRPARLKGAHAPRLTVPGALVLRLRAAFGVGAKADVLAFLVSQAGRPTTARAAGAVLGYAEITVRRALQDLVAAGFARDTSALTPEPGPDPGRYAVLPTAADALAPGAPGAVPPWRSCLAFASFWLHAARWGADLPPDDPDRDYLLASSARRLHDRLQAVRHETAYVLPDPARFPAAAFLAPFVGAVADLGAWTLRGLTTGSPALEQAPAPDGPLDLAPAGRSFLLPPVPSPPSMTDALTAYLARVQATLRTGDATEHSHRPALQALLEASALAALGRPPSVVNEPRRTRVGAPDFVVRLAGVPLGYAEAKDVGVPLDAETEQVRRYRAGLRNLLFTDGLTFRWFADGAERDAVTLATREGDGPAVRLRPADGAADALASLLGAFFRFEAPAVATARELATRLAAATRLLRDAIAASFAAEEERGTLHQQFEAFRDVLLGGLTPAAFADMYAQTLAYGLFAARAANPAAEGFSRLTAAAHLPRTNPFLQKLFYEVAGPDLDDRIAWLVDDLATLLARTDLAAILTDFGRRTRREDAVVHFYETFLQAYDPALRELRGVFYTPEPVVGYLVRSADALLARDFGLPAGLADDAQTTLSLPDAEGHPRPERLHRVQILDPATGTGTFLHAVLRAIHARFRDQGDEGLWDGYVADHLLPRVHGFELLMAPYTVAHLKLGLFLQETGYTFSRDERLSVFLTNALDADTRAGEAPIPFARWLADEASAAGRVKRDLPVMVVLGNPPYSGHSANTGEWITKLMRGEDTQTGRTTESYFEVDGGPLGEKNPKWLNDDYVKFVRMAQEQVVRAGQGVVAFVTNHGFLDNPTFRGMRQSLTAAFDRVYLLDLHGNAKKKETTPEGGRDENVFDIMQGVSLALLVRLPDHDGGAPAEVFHADLWGSRADKYAALDAADVTTTTWTRLQPQSPAYLFRPQDHGLRAAYEEGWSVTDVFPVNSVGVVTARDGLTIHFSEGEAWDTVQRFAALNEEEAREAFALGKDARDWKVALAQADVRRTGPDRARLGPILYRPFDWRTTYYTGTSRGFQCMPRWDVMRHMAGGGNLGLITTRQTRDDWDALVTEHPIGHKALAAYDINTLFPLWLLADAGGGLFASGERAANLAPDFVAALGAATGLAWAEHGPPADAAFTPEDVFHYVYGVLHAPAYRARYADFLRADFPRVPLPPSREAFRALAAVGRRLVALHLLRELPPPATRFPVKGSGVVEKGFPVYAPPGTAGPNGETAPDGRVFLNATQFVGGVEPEVWAHEVGGYQVLGKWLKDRRGRALTYDDLRHYGRVVTALRQTQMLMAEADRAAQPFGW